MWLFERVKKRPYLAVATTFFLGAVSCFIVPVVTTVSIVSIVITAGICIVVGLSLGGCLGWLVEKINSNRPVPVSEVDLVFQKQEEEKHNLSQPVPSVFENEVKKLDGVSTSLIQKAFSSEEDYTSILASYLDHNDAGNLTQTSITLYRSFISSSQGKAGLKLLQHAVCGEEKEINAFVKDRSPQQLQFLLFTFETTITHYSGQQIKGNFIRILLGAEDTDMIRMIQPVLIRACGSEKAAQAELKRQYDAQFSKESKEAEAKKAAADSAALHKMIQAIHNAEDKDCEDLLVQVDDSKDTENTAVGLARAQFRAHWNEKTKAVITSGKHSNAEPLAKAFNQYDANYHAFGNHWNSPKNKLVWRQVIGWIERYVSTCIAQALRQGDFYIVNNGEQLRRSLQFRFSPSYSDFSLSSDGLRLGYDYAVFGRWPRPSGMFWVRELFGPFFTTYVQKKQRDGELICTVSANSGQRQVVAP